MTGLPVYGLQTSVMNMEIERKFLVAGDFSADVYACRRIVQGYICTDPGKTVRVRIQDQDGFLTIKGPSDGEGMSRYEFEQAIPLEDTERLLLLCEPGVIDKVRHLARVGNHVWEIDVFHGANEGLVLAEIELGAEDESFAMPVWAGKEVTGDRRYYNSMLARHPFSEWK